MGSSRDSDFDEWVLHNRVRLQKTAFLMCGDWHLADDLVQDALIKSFPKWQRIANAGDPAPFMRKTLIRLCVDHGRRPSRREVTSATIRETVPASDPDFDHLLHALQEVPTGQRAVLILRYFDGLSVEETAAATRTSVGNVKSQSSRGMDVLRSILVTTPESDKA